VTIWLPYVDEPLFTAELIIGPDAVPERQRQQLIGYLEELAARRGVLHPAVAFNAVYFGYDFNYGGYPGGPVDFDRLPEVQPDQPAPPVGAMVSLSVGREPLLGEVLYAEGAHAALGDDGHVEPWLSGAPGDAAGPSGATVPRDRLVLDFDAFGPGVTASRERLARLRRRGRLLDELGHLVMPAHGREGFVEFLLGPGRDCLVEGPLPLLLGTDANSDDLEAGVRGTLATLDTLLSQAPRLQRWGQYAFPRAALKSRLADKDAELGGADLASIINGIIRPPSARRHHYTAENIAYTAIGPRLWAFAADGVILGGVAYAVAVCHANVELSRVARHKADGQGALPSGGHLRLDDAWQGGGIWRVSHPAGPYAGHDPLSALGLGWLESLPPVAEAHPLTAEPEPEPTEQLYITDSQIDWTVPLRLSHHVAGTLPLPARLTEEMQAGAMRLRLEHDGYDLDPDEADQIVRVERGERGLSLAGVGWPLEYFPGILLDFWWPRGAPTLNARSTLLDVPVMIDGEAIQHGYDPGIVTRDSAPGSAIGGRSARLGPRERIIRAIRRAGLLQPDGGVVLPEGALISLILDDPAAGLTAISVPLAELLAEGILHRSVASRNREGALTFPAARGESELSVLIWQPQIVPIAQENPRQRSRDLTTRLRAHDVRSFLRRLRPGEKASDTARAEYRKIGNHFGFGAELPVGYTIVRAHRRGS
jgi:hypothetical protein